MFILHKETYYSIQNNRKKLLVTALTCEIMCRGDAQCNTGEWPEAPGDILYIGVSKGCPFAINTLNSLWVLPSLLKFIYVPFRKYNHLSRILLVSYINFILSHRFQLTTIIYISGNQWSRCWWWWLGSHLWVLCPLFTKWLCRLIIFHQN